MASPCQASVMLVQRTSRRCPPSSNHDTSDLLCSGMLNMVPWPGCSDTQCGPVIQSRAHWWLFCRPADRAWTEPSPPDAPAASPSELPSRPPSSPAAAEFVDSLASPLPLDRPWESGVSGHLPDSRPRAGQWPDRRTRTAVSSQEARGWKLGSSSTSPCTALTHQDAWETRLS